MRPVELMVDEIVVVLRTWCVQRSLKRDDEASIGLWKSVQWKPNSTCPRRCCEVNGVVDCNGVRGVGGEEDARCGLRRVDRPRADDLEGEGVDKRVVARGSWCAGARWEGCGGWRAGRRSSMIG